jgi:hypothetical protein
MRPVSHETPPKGLTALSLSSSSSTLDAAVNPPERGLAEPSKPLSSAKSLGSGPRRANTDAIAVDRATDGCRSAPLQKLADGIESVPLPPLPIAESARWKLLPCGTFWIASSIGSGSSDAAPPTVPVLHERTGRIPTARGAALAGELLAQGGG